MARDKVEETLQKILNTEEKVKTSEDGHAVEFPDDAKIENLGLVQPPTLSDINFDPFEKHKTDKDKFSYRALNKRPLNLEKKEAMGWKVVEDSTKGGSVQYGDLVLAKMPKPLQEVKTKKKQAKADDMSRAVKKIGKQELNQMGYKTED